MLRKTIPKQKLVGWSTGHEAVAAARAADYQATAANAPHCMELNDAMKQCEICGSPDVALEYYSHKLDNAIAGSGEYKLHCRTSWMVMHFRSTGQWKSEP